MAPRGYPVRIEPTVNATLLPNAPQATRTYDAAKPGRATAGWRRPWTSARSETYLALPWLRASSHDLVRNDPHSAKIIGTLATDLVGTGIMPKANTGNKRLNKKVDEIAKAFFANMDADGVTANYAGFQLLAARSFLESGEAILRRYIRPSRMGLKVPLQFSLLESEFLDNLYNTALPSGHRVIQGIEFDADNIRSRYHLFKEHPGDTYMGSIEGSFERIPVLAEDIRIIYEPQRPGQIRGVPWITPILLRAKQLSDYEDAERQRKQIESSIPAIVRSQEQSGEASDPGITSLFPTVTDVDGHIIERVEPGMIAYLRNATEVDFPKPADAMGYGPFKRSELQSMAAGARSTYELVSGDLSQTNFSSIQAGLLTYRGMIDVIRATMIVPRLEWIWGCMIDMAIVAGSLPENTPKGVEHHAPPWLPVDPQKQAEANLIMIRSGEKSLREVVMARGKDFDDHLDEIEAANKALDRRKMILDSDPRRVDKRGVEQQNAANVKGNAPPPSEDDPDQA
ncbi:phage portal protein [Beijerinckia sp. L45]|uniref:phage portal protein n=1 Tax=Beijerinckia sp. L45 TaxID=1641855 RepID=UPI00131DC18E|nr:phage portal protein [Beijerinckia sp. L45]